MTTETYQALGLVVGGYLVCRLLLSIFTVFDRASLETCPRCGGSGKLTVEETILLRQEARKKDVEREIEALKAMIKEKSSASSELERGKG